MSLERVYDESRPEPPGRDENRSQMAVTKYYPEDKKIGLVRICSSAPASWECGTTLKIAFVIMWVIEGPGGGRRKFVGCEYSVFFYFYKRIIYRCFCVGLGISRTVGTVGRSLLDTVIYGLIFMFFFSLSITYAFRQNG